jgi:hypothetical protein
VHVVTTFPSRPHSRSQAFPVRFLDKYFYFCMSLLVAVAVVYGFSQTIDANLFHPPVPRPLLLSFHAACFSLWVAFFIFQSALVRTHNVRIHRVTGWFGAGLGVTMVALGYSTAVVMGRFELHTLHAASAAAFLIVPFFDITNFAVLFSLAILWRRRPEFHRRLILLATCEITSAAFGRMPFHYPMPLLFYIGVDALLLLGPARDLIVNRRIHKVYLCALPVLFVCQCAVVYVFTHEWPVWLRISRPILG